MWRAVNKDLYLSGFVKNDRTALVELLKDREIYEATCRIPFPYTEKDADEWIQRTASEAKEYGTLVNWAIRDASGTLVGAVGFHDIDAEKTQSAELGYWVGKAHWGKGIASAVVAKVASVALEEFDLKRVTATVKEGNERSARVLLKCGFQLEAGTRSVCATDNRSYEARVYVLTPKKA